MRRSIAPAVLLAGLVLTLPAVAQPKPPDETALVFLKDGFVLHGKIKEEQARILDPIGKGWYTLKKGFFFIDDDVRRYYFSHLQVQDKDRGFRRGEDTVSKFRQVILPQGQRLPPILEVTDTTGWDANWEREMTYRGVDGMDRDCVVTVPQRLQILNSFYACVDTTKYWPLRSCYLTRELGPDLVRKLLLEHPHLKDSPRLKPEQRAERRFRFYRFLVHANWLDEADKELDRIANDLPAEKKKVEEERERLKKLQTQRYFDDIRRGHRAQRRAWVAEQFGKFPEKYATSKAIEEVRTLKSAYATSDEKVKQTKQYLTDLVERLKTSVEREIFGDAIAAVKAELLPDTVGRLDAFLNQAKQAARQEKMKGRADQPAAEILALAVTGWLLGNSATAETRIDTARRLWLGRQMILKYLRTENLQQREALLAKAQVNRELPTIDEMILLLATLPPVEADKDLPKGIVERKARDVSYHLQLPAEYSHYRPYPVLIVLANGNEEPKVMMERWAEQARLEGYILAAPHWQLQNISGGYGYTEAEHETVLETLRDLKRKYNVDSDRVFLFGLGAGGTMALDVGLSHPDLFAGVLPMCANPEYFCRIYWPNAQYLPLYVVTGDMMGKASETTRNLFEKWITHGYPAMHVQYKGRGVEWYTGELPAMFEWMARKRRLVPVTQLGRQGSDDFGDNFKSMRAGDNRFYWISGEVSPGMFNDAAHWRVGNLGAHLTARVDPAKNTIFTTQGGFQRLTIWLGRDAKIDFDKPIDVWVNGIMKAVAARRVQPSLTTLLEDFAARGDRQRLFVARIDFRP